MAVGRESLANTTPGKTTHLTVLASDQCTVDPAKADPIRNAATPPAVRLAASLLYTEKLGVGGCRLLVAAGTPRLGG